MTDTADLVKELDALFARATPGPWVPARRRGSWDWVVVQQSPRMNYEICQMFHDGTDFNEIGEANTRLICMLKTSWPAIRAALESTQARADKLEAELASAQQSNENWMNRCLAAEARAAAMREATIAECAQVAFTECKYPKAAKLISDRIRALKTAAGKEIPRRQLFADMEEAWVNQKHYWRCKGCPDCQGIK